MSLPTLPEEIWDEIYWIWAVERAERVKAAKRRVKAAAERVKAAAERRREYQWIRELSILYEMGV